MGAVGVCWYGLCAGPGGPEWWGGGSLTQDKTSGACVVGPPGPRLELKWNSSRRRLPCNGPHNRSPKPAVHNGPVGVRLAGDGNRLLG